MPAWFSATPRLPAWFEPFHLQTLLFLNVCPFQNRLPIRLKKRGRKRLYCCWGEWRALRHQIRTSQSVLLHSRGRTSIYQSQWDCQDIVCGRVVLCFCFGFVWLDQLKGLRQSGKISGDSAIYRSQITLCHLKEHRSNYSSVQVI